MSAMTTARKNASGGQPFSERWTFAGEGQALTYVEARVSRGVVQSVTSQLSHGSEETEAPGSKMKEARVLSYDYSTLKERRFSKANTECPTMYNGTDTK